MPSVAIAGVTGSVGRQAGAVVSRDPERFHVETIVAGSDAGGLIELAKELRPRVVGLAVGGDRERVRQSLDASVEVVVGREALEASAAADIVVNAVSGFAGLAVTRAALLAGRRLALANKESLVAAGDLVAGWLDGGDGELVPVDSEHSAIFQCLGGSRDGADRVASLVLTSSGGPFRTRSAEALRDVSLEEALAHPTWSMGPKITVDSSTLFNKGLEVIEAHYLFEVPYDRIEVVVHPESVVHSMVRFRDGSVIAQLSEPTMELPVAVALYHPERAPYAIGSLDLTRPRSFGFEPVDDARFPALRLAYDAGRLGGAAPCWLNAANEVAVAAFLGGALRWIDIYRVVASTLERFEPTTFASEEDVIEADATARDHARRIVEEVTRG
ncbi:1-deoxy-D-xylulose 5-phosphate reductoisomerase [Acidimicrobium ferrooxidans DSM 10331]|uniref:1-deoxy-D-xylulose 5-phosphate reductoisomerase n=1 Tax=Acidimicrobium ferrooxidans (strain DSM 10331 / JCM 15462 / NBRC 103882 / ICP) TaxID=525909 RepID=C7LXX7_ACIFD|nr:1-deoxy-D-xylulose-5-phosphate reductoisomerase [Acidimicrobium ferrooxidans]ACU53585.1 1-deoxy-D-xylulose 5-phosphate reductoisomerase [Acidimicrobium ferrooxidans DSM 10331]